MAKPNPIKTAIRTFRALNPRHGFHARTRAQEEKEGEKEKEKGPMCGELFLYDAIGADWYGGISAQMVADAVRAMEKDGAGEMNIYINSPGGDIFEGAAIYSCLSRFEGDKHVYVDGLAASAASFIAMVGDDITTAFNAMWMVHNPWGIAIGDKNLMRDTADRLEKIGGVMADTYVRRTKQPRADILALMDAETWMDAQEARGRGFTDVVSEEDDEEEGEGKKEDPTAPAPESSARVSVLSRYRKVPATLRPAASALIRTMEQRVMNFPRQASLPGAPGQPGRK